MSFREPVQSVNNRVETPTGHTLAKALTNRGNNSPIKSSRKDFLFSDGWEVGRKRVWEEEEKREGRRDRGALGGLQWWGGNVARDFAGPLNAARVLGVFI